MKFSIKNFFSKCDLIDKTADLVTFTEVIFNRENHFLCGETCYEVFLNKKGGKWPLKYRKIP